MAAVINMLLESILDDRGLAVPDAGAILLRELSGNKIQRSDFLADPTCLTAPPYFVPRYVAQVTLRALRGDYESIEDLAQGLQALSDRNPPTLEPARQRKPESKVLPEARVVELRQPVRQSVGHWEAGIVALVTSGPLTGREVDIRIDSRENRNTCFLVACLWLHASISAYNLTQPDGNDAVFVACPETFVVIEPMRQINVTSVARSLHCTKPQLDQMRRGKGDTTLQTLKGTIIHGIFDRMLEGEKDLSKLCDEVLRGYAVQVASVIDDFFDEAAFREDIMRHLVSLQGFLDAHPRLLEDAQIELKRYSATIGIQGRIDAVFRQGNKIDILELKTGARIRPEDHAQLFIYRLLLSDMVRRWQRDSATEVEITARLLSSVDGAFAPLQIQTDFYQVLEARNRLLATQYAMSVPAPHFRLRYEGFNEDVCEPCPSWVRRRCKDSTTAFGDRPGMEVTRALEYFTRLTSLVERERWSVDQEIADLLDDSRTETRKMNFRALLNARIVPDSEPFTFEFSENTSDLEIGDAVLIHGPDISSTAIYHGRVHDVGTRRLRISVPLKNLKPDVFDGRDWTIDRLPADVTAEASHTALYDFLMSPDDSRKAAILGKTDRDFRELPAMRTGTVPVPGLNESQQRAIDRAGACDVFHLIWGPPGTGKTKVIPQIVAKVRDRGRVLLGAFTNTAVDKMLMALLAADPTVRFLRIGRAADSPELAALLKDPADFFSEDLARKYGGIQAIRQALDAASIVAATAHRSCTMPYLRQHAFEMVIVDEAGQLTEPLTLGLILRGRRFVLIGDDRQLPPVVRTRALARSMFERLKTECERTRHDLTLLDTQYRMHPQIMAVSNRLFYEGRLRSGVRESDRTSPDGAPVTMVPVLPARREAAQSDERMNLDEAEAVATLVRHYCHSGISASTIGVISPFRAQVVLLRKLLHGSGVTVDTVERFQGGERDIMMLSFVRSQGRGFVFDERRFNVAITRARRKLVLFAHPDLFRNSRYEWICTFTETPRTVGTT